MPLTSQTEWFL